MQTQDTRGFTPHGKHLAAGEWVGGKETFTSSPAHGPAHECSVGIPELVARAWEAKAGAFDAYAATSREDRARFLDAIADEIEDRAEAITAIGTQESGLPEGRLQGERGRTTGKLRLFAAHRAAIFWTARLPVGSRTMRYVFQHTPRFSASLDNAFQIPG